MGIFSKFSGWLTNKSDQFIRGTAGEHEGGYYATREAREAYSHMGSEPEAEGAAEEQAERRPAGDPFGHGEDEYGGRVPYRSKYDIAMEAYQKQQQAAQQAAPQQPPAQPQAAQPQAALQQAFPAQGYAAPAYAQQQPGSNVLPFPGMRQGPDGMVYAHVEYIVLLRSRNECKDVIGYIKTNASVFLNMEFIASDSERQRCVDMLSGAAYTLGCALNKISPRGIYLISAPTVRVVLDPAMQKFAAAPEAQGYARQRYAQEGYAAQQPAPQPQQSYEAAPVQQPSMQPLPPEGAFSPQSPTARFQAQGTQRMRPVSFGTAMAGYPEAMASGQNNAGYAPQRYPQ